MVRLKVRVLVLVLSILVVCMGNALAMQFYQPEELGYISFYMAQNGGAYFQGESNVTGKYHRSSIGIGREYYGQGIVKYGSGRDVIYIHYDTTEPYYCNARVGSKDIGNTVEVFLQSDTVKRIRTSDDITLYVFEYAHSFQHFYTIIGKIPSGKFVKYIDSRDIASRYYGEKANRSIQFQNFICSGDTIVIPYAFYHGTYIEKVGEFRFKWDEDAQWFGIEQVLY